MKSHIEVDQLIKLSAEQILTLSNHKLIDTVWFEWNKVEKVLEAVNVFKAKGWMHSTLLKTTKSCNTTNMIAILNEYGHVEIENLHSEFGTRWHVNINHDVDMDKFYFEADELCDALWKATQKALF